MFDALNHCATAGIPVACSHLRLHLINSSVIVKRAHWLRNPNNYLVNTNYFTRRHGDLLKGYFP